MTLVRNVKAMICSGVICAGAKYIIVVHMQFSILHVCIVVHVHVYNSINMQC